MDSTLNTTNPQYAFSEPFRELLGFLFREPFAINNRLHELNFEEIGLILEEPFGGDEQLSESYNSCKSTYCLMLLELELQGLSSLPQNLTSIPLKDLSEFAIFTETDFAGTPPIEADTKNSLQSDKVHQLISELELDLDSEPKTALNDVSQILSASPPEAEAIAVIPTESFDTILSPLANEYLSLSLLFKNNLHNEENTPKQEANMRAIAHFKIGALEIELFNKIRTDIEHIWHNRVERIHSFLQSDSFRFNDNQEKEFQVIEQQFSAVLYDERFPRLAALHCLKYLSLVQSVDALQPTVFEIGALIYFWGTQDPCPFDQFNFLTAQQRLEIALRLFRLDRLKAIGTNFNKSFSQEQLSQIEDDINEIFNFLNFKRSENVELKVA